MARYTSNDRTYEYLDGKPDFPTWIASDPTRQSAWQTAADEYYQHKVKHGAPPQTSACDGFFNQWMTETSAVEIKE